MNKINEYRNSPYLNYSGMKKLLISPAHYQSWLEEQSKPEEPESAFRTGSATHMLSMQPEQFDSMFAVAPLCDRRTNIGKQTWAEFLEASPGKTVLTADEFITAQHCADSVRRNTWFKKAIEDPKVLIEKDLYLKNDNIFKYGIKGRPDVISPSNQFILDIKTHGKELTKYDIRKAIMSNKYHLQELVYTVLANNNDIQVNDFIFIFVEKREPYSAVSVGIDNPILTKEAMDMLTNAVDSFNRCMDSGKWEDLNNTSIIV